ncbi:MAG TPA: alkane 1-monooxygenase [Rugosibacter sp.]
MSKYLKGWLMPACFVLTTLAFMKGGIWLGVPFIAMLGMFVIGDAILPRDLSDSTGLKHPFLLNLPLYVQLPLLVVVNFVLVWMFGSGDIGGVGAWVREYSGIDMFAAREATTHWWMWVGGVASVTLLNALGGTNTGHELTHRTASPFDMFVGRWMLAFTADTSFAIEHVYGHHVRVATPADPATARRGESFYRFTLRSTVISYVHAYQLEMARLAKLGKSIWNPLASPFMRGNLENIALFVAAFFIAGWSGVWFWAIVALVGKQYLELVNYFEHYGLVRVSGQPVQPHHSWNSNHWVSSAVLYSLARHSHHHAEAEAPYWMLRDYRNAPMLPYGYLTMIMISLVPPFFKKSMLPGLNEWDEKHATPEERKLALEVSKASGMRGLKILGAVVA